MREQADRALLSLACTELRASAFLLLPLLLSWPREFYDRVSGYAGAGLERVFGRPPDYETVGWTTVLGDLEARLGEVENILNEPMLVEIEEGVRRVREDIRHENAYGTQWGADALLSRCCYLVCRLTKPDVVLETGVAYGVSSAFILGALEQNGRGVLHSVDLPPLRRNSERFWGIAVPEPLKSRWNLHRGASERILPDLLQEIGTVDVFVHDSLHTLWHMRREFELVWPYLGDGGVILADDVERNRAFGELRRCDPALWRVVTDVEPRPLVGKAARTTFGIAIK